MKKEWQNLRTLWWNKAGETLKVRSANGTIAVILGIVDRGDSADERAYGYILKSSSERVYNFRDNEKESEKMDTFCADRDHWKIYVPPKVVPHWPAIYERHDHGGGAKYRMSLTLYANEEHAQRCIRHSGKRFIRLATEIKGIMLPEEE